MTAPITTAELLQGDLSRHCPSMAQYLRIKAEQPIDWVTRLPQLRIPTLVVHGELDALYRIEHMRYTQSPIRDSEPVVMEVSGHLQTLTRPLNVAEHIERFFAARGVWGRRERWQAGR